ncbi:hypothetical protein DIPPA_26146 [Diplonema papillatum]|nr:hypothetical protein DIPPA_26146 [Diplonema papillatum]
MQVIATEKSKHTVAVVTGQGAVSLWGPDFTCLARCENGPKAPPTCCAAGGNVLFIGSTSGEVTAVQCTKDRATVLGSWDATDGSIAAISGVVCTEGYVAVSTGHNVTVWDPFPAAGYRSAPPPAAVQDDDPSVPVDQEPNPTVLVSPAEDTHANPKVLVHGPRTSPRKPATTSPRALAGSKANSTVLASSPGEETHANPKVPAPAPRTSPPRGLSGSKPTSAGPVSPADEDARGNPKLPARGRRASPQKAAAANPRAVSGSKPNSKIPGPSPADDMRARPKVLGGRTSPRKSPAAASPRGLSGSKRNSTAPGSPPAEDTRANPSGSKRIATAPGSPPAEDTRGSPKVLVRGRRTPPRQEAAAADPPALCVISPRNPPAPGAPDADARASPKAVVRGLRIAPPKGGLKQPEIARRLHSFDKHGFAVKSLTLAGTTVLSVDDGGHAYLWGVLDPLRAHHCFLKTPSRITSMAATPGGWSASLIWCLRHDTMNRYMYVQNPQLTAAQKHLLAAQTEVVSSEVRTRCKLQALGGIIDARLAHHLGLINDVTCVFGLLRDYYRKFGTNLRFRIMRKRMAVILESMFYKSLCLHVTYGRLERHVAYAKAKRMARRVGFVLLFGRDVGAAVLHLVARYFRLWGRGTARRAKRRRSKREQTEASCKQRLGLAGALARAGDIDVCRRYFFRCKMLWDRAKARIPKHNSAETLLRCTVYGTLRSIWYKWKKWTTMKHHQRAIVGRSLAKGDRGNRLFYYTMWRHWAAAQRAKKRFDDVMRAMGDIGLLHAFYRKLKMYPSWKSVKEMSENQEAASRYFSTLVREEQELLGTVAPVTDASWPACAITSALGMNIEKWMKEGMVFFAGESQDYTRMRAVADKLQQAWMKAGDVLTELAENLIAPINEHGVERGREEKDAMLWHLSKDLAKKYKKTFEGSGIGPVELLAMRLYTLEGPDVDRHMGFGDVPPPFNSVPEHMKETLMRQWDEYKKTHASISKPTVTGSKVTGHATQQGDRNPSIYHEMNKALRTSEDIQKWAKLSSLLLALSMPIEEKTKTEKDESEAKVLYRGIHNLPDVVIEAHKALHRGWSYAWLAPSSTSESRQASEDFLKTTDPKTNILFEVHGCTEGLPLHQVSQFPDEAEVLLPPFSTFVVSEAPTQTDLYLTIHLQFKGTLAKHSTSMQDFIQDVRSDAHVAAQRRHCLDATKQLQEVEEAARTYNRMERDLMITRADTLHRREVASIRLREVEAKKQAILKRVLPLQLSVDHKTKLVDNLAPSNPNPIRQLVMTLKEDGLINYFNDAPAIAKMTASGYTGKTWLQMAKESYFDVKGMVTRHAGHRKKPNEPWPLGFVKRLSPLDRKKSKAAFRNFGLAADALSAEDCRALLSVMDKPLDGFAAFHCKLRRGRADESAASSFDTSSFLSQSASTADLPMPPSPSNSSRRLTIDHAWIDVGFPAASSPNDSAQVTESFDSPPTHSLPETAPDGSARGTFTSSARSSQEAGRSYSIETLQ